MYLSVNQVAAILGVGRDTVVRIFADVPGIVDLGRGKYRKLRIPQSVLDRFITECTVSESE